MSETEIILKILSNKNNTASSINNVTFKKLIKFINISKIKNIKI